MSSFEGFFQWCWGFEKELMCSTWLIFMFSGPPKRGRKLMGVWTVGTGELATWTESSSLHLHRSFVVEKRANLADLASHAMTIFPAQIRSASMFLGSQKAIERYWAGLEYSITCIPRILER